MRRARKRFGTRSWRHNYHCYRRVVIDVYCLNGRRTRGQRTARQWIAPSRWNGIDFESKMKYIRQLGQGRSGVGQYPTARLPVYFVTFRSAEHVVITCSDLYAARKIYQRDEPRRCGRRSSTAIRSRRNGRITTGSLRHAIWLTPAQSGTLLSDHLCRVAMIKITSGARETRSSDGSGFATYIFPTANVDVFGFFSSPSDVPRRRWQFCAAASYTEFHFHRVPVEVI